MSLANAVLSVALLASLHTTYLKPTEQYNCVLQAMPDPRPNFDVLEVRVIDMAGGNLIIRYFLSGN